MATVVSQGTSVFSRLSERIRRFRDASRARSAAAPPSPRHADFNTAFFGRHARRPHWERYTRSIAAALQQQPVYLFDDERLVGMLYQTSGQCPIPAEFDQDFEPYSPGPDACRRSGDVDLPFQFSGWPGHIGWRWDVVLDLGVEGLMARLRALLEKAPDARAKRLYRGALIMWRSVLRWNDRHVEALRQKLQEADDEQERERLGELIALCRAVPRRPARSFREALQAFYMQYLALMFENPYGGNGPGRVDYFLWPYLERDLAGGGITEAEAKDLIDELLIRMHERLPNADGWVEGIMIGGSHADGTCSLNPLSSMILDSIGALDQTHPSVYTRISADGPQDFLDINVQYLLHGGNRAQIYNEPACLRAITRTGVPPQDAAMFMAGGCMEISVQGMASDMNFTGAMNVAKTLELVLNGGMDMLTGERRIPPGDTLAEFEDFKSLYAAFEAELAREFSEFTRALDVGSECFARWRPAYLLSSLVGDCLERGREQHDGGARYHDYGFSPLGVTAAADSLNAIRRAVYDEVFVSGSELLEAMRADYRGHEELRLRLAALPRYGVEDAAADAMADRVLTSVCTTATGIPNRFGGSLKPMLFTFVWGPGAARELAARADGQRAGARIGHGMTPQSVAMTDGITAAMNSCVSIDLDPVSGGATTMWDVDPQWITFDLMKALLLRFLKGGGMIFQGNTTSADELRHAMDHPEQHPNLLVRVGGYSARFVTLGPDLQEDILNRYRHSA